MLQCLIPATLTLVSKIPERLYLWPWNWGSRVHWDRTLLQACFQEWPEIYECIEDCRCLSYPCSTPLPNAQVCINKQKTWTCMCINRLNKHLNINSCWSSVFHGISKGFTSGLMPCSSWPTDTRMLCCFSWYRCVTRSLYAWKEVSCKDRDKNQIWPSICTEELRKS